MYIKADEILSKYGWRRSKSGKVEYKGFEHLLNPDLEDWRLVLLPEPEEPLPEPTPVEELKNKYKALKKS